MKITRDLIKHLGSLSRLDLTEEEVDEYRNDFQSMIDFFDVINELDTSNIKIEKEKLNAKTELREDEIEKGLDNKDVIKNAPESLGGAILVPTIVE